MTYFEERGLGLDRWRPRTKREAWNASNRSNPPRIGRGPDGATEPTEILDIEAQRFEPLENIPDWF